MQLPDVLLYAKYNFHLSCLAPIFGELNRFGVNARLETKRHHVYDAFHRKNKKYPIIVLADEWINLFRECADIVITTGHSMASKNTTFNSKNSEADYICVTSQWYKNEFIKRGVIPRKDFLLTGYPAADKIFRKEISHEIASTAFNGKKKILIAPTYNKDLSLVGELCNKMTMISLMPQYHFIFKGHPVLPKKYPNEMNLIKGYAEAYENFTFIEDTHDDIAYYINWCDVFVGDCSGAMILAIIRGKPILAFNNHNKSSSEYFDPIGVEWDKRDDFAYEFSDFNNLKIMIEASIENDWKRGRRIKARNLIYGEYQDGKSSERIATEILKLLG